jgi:hypothetical protein
MITEVFFMSKFTIIKIKNLIKIPFLNCPQELYMSFLFAH